MPILQQAARADGCLTRHPSTCKAVHVLCVAPPQRLHEPGNAVWLVWADEQMHVVGHECVGMNSAAVFVGTLFEPMQVAVVIVFAKEGCRTVVPTLHDVLRVPNQIHADPWGSPHRLRPGTSPHALRIPPRDGHPALRSIARKWLQVRLGCVRLLPSCPFRLLHTCFLSSASEALPPLLDMAPLIREPEGLTLPNNALLSAHYGDIRLLISVNGGIMVSLPRPARRCSGGRR